MKVASAFFFSSFVLILSAGAQVQHQPLELETDTVKIRVVRIADGLESPWSMVFLPSGDILVTERPGRLRIIRNGKLQEEPIAGGPG